MEAAGGSEGPARYKLWERGCIRLGVSGCSHGLREGLKSVWGSWVEDDCGWWWQGRTYK